MASLERREFLKLIGGLGLGIVFSNSLLYGSKTSSVRNNRESDEIKAEQLTVPGSSKEESLIKIKRPQEVGFTFSSLQCQRLHMDESQTNHALETLCNTGFDTIRLCTYWDRIDRKNGFDFTDIDWQLDMAEKYNLRIILTAGIKSPRWPEFFFSDRVKTEFPRITEEANPVERYPKVTDHALAYISRLVEHTRDHPAIEYYQIGNESLNPVSVTKLRYLSYLFVKREFELVKNLKKDGQKILLTNSVGGPQAEESFNDTLQLKPDALGINVYYKVPYELPVPVTIYHNVFSETRDRIVGWHRRMIAAQIKPFATEVQAEPWELDKDMLDQRELPSANPKDSIDLAYKLAEIGYIPIFWGAEYWVAHQMKFGGEAWLTPIKQFVNNEYRQECAS